ncbi:neprilysin-1-like [Ornithodoros turicata]|uniref:neprilysin-1-like n=1 Tax=Ornithodoros turicata TaxID=34597 RepID=UPI00313A3F49
MWFRTPPIMDAGNIGGIPGPISPRRNHTRCSRCARAMGIISVAVVLLGAVLYAVFSLLGFKTAISTDQDTVCSSPSCLHLAEALGRSLNSSANPCADFFQFACGVSAKEDVFETSSAKVLEAARDALTSSVNISNDPHKLLQKASQLYQECGDVRRKNRKDARDLLFFLKQRRLDLSGEPDVEPLDVALSLDLRYGLKTLFDISVLDGYLVIRKRSNLAAWIARKSKLVQQGSYETYIEHVFTTLDFRNGTRTSEIVDLVLKTDEIVLSLLSFHSKVTEGASYNTIFIYNATNTLVLRKPGWKTHFQKHYDRVVTRQPVLDYLEALFAQTTSTSLVTYVIWEAVRQMGPFTDYRLIPEDEDLDATGQRCFEAVMTVLGVPVLSYVLAEGVKASSILSAKTLFHKVVQSFYSATNLTLLRDFSIDIVNSGELLASQSIADRYEDLAEVRQPFLMSYLRALAVVRQQELESIDALGQFVKSEHLFGYKILYDKQRKLFTVPTSLLRDPFFAEDAPPGVRFGGLGRIIARGLGSSLPKNLGVTACLRHMSNERVKEDIITDTVVINTLYDAFKPRSNSLVESAEMLRQDGLFFLAYCHLWCNAQDASPAACNLPLMNSVKFSHAFRCPAGSAMAPAKICLANETARAGLGNSRVFWWKQ